MRARSLFLSFLLALSALASTADARPACAEKDTREISQVFDRAIDLNERFKKALRDRDETAYRTLRTQVERYGEETAFPCARRAASLLAKKSDKELMRNLMRLVISFENSADETLSASLGVIFAKNPDAIEDAIKDFPPAEQRVIMKSVQVGWVNTKRGVAANIVKDRGMRISRFKL